jgi:hypothetical protein
MTRGKACLCDVHSIALHVAAASLDYTEKYFARGFNTTIALVDCSGCN